MRTKIWLDTDIGTDSDDAICLAYLLLQEDCELVGISTVGRDSLLRADIARTLCSHFGRPDIPVAAGCDRPFLPNPYWDDHHVNQHGIIPGTPATGPARPNDAIEQMRTAIEAAPGEITLLTVGMLSNAALLLSGEPETASLLKAVYSMGGRFTTGREIPHGECNVMLDAVAASIVAEKLRPPLTLVPGNVTSSLGMDDGAMYTLLAGDKLGIVRKCCEAWIEAKGKPGTGLHDPFTAACVFDASYCRWEQGRLTVPLTHQRLDRDEALPVGAVNGYTVFEPSSDGPHRLAVDRDRDRFMKHLHDVFRKAR